MLLVLTALLWGAMSCADRDETGAEQAQPAAGRKTRDCQVRVNSEPWTMFADLTGRLAAGQAVPRAELEAFGALPAVSVWRASQEPNVPTAARVGNWLAAAWREDISKTGKKKINSDRIAMGRSYRYSQQHRAEIDAQLREFTAGNRTCELRELAEAWLAPEQIPTPLVLNFVPAVPEIRIADAEIFIDTGVLHAGGTDQTLRQIAALLYRDLAAVPGANPIESDGEQAVAECLRVLLNEGIAGRIEQTTAIEFGTQHPSLARVKIVPEDFYRKAQQTVEKFETWLPEMLADPAIMAGRGRSFARALAASGAFSKTGLVMADVIVARFGAERLHQVHQSVPGFFAAYQEAARLNPTPVPDPGTSGIELYESVRAFPEELYEPLQEILDRHYGSP
jgi:hypothetical protein